MMTAIERTIFILSGVLVLLCPFVNGSSLLENLISRRLRNRKVSFEALLTVKNQHLVAGTTVVFPGCDLNDGQGYSTRTGIFTAPLSGVYIFTAHICNSPGKYMVFAIMKNSIQLARSTAYEDRDSACGFVNTIVRLKEGDNVSVQAQWAHSFIWAEVNRINSFTGFLLYA